MFHVMLCLMLTVGMKYLLADMSNPYRSNWNIPKKMAMNGCREGVCALGNVCSVQGWLLFSAKYLYTGIVGNIVFLESQVFPEKGTIMLNFPILKIWVIDSL